MRESIRRFLGLRTPEAQPDILDRLLQSNLRHADGSSILQPPRRPRTPEAMAAAIQRDTDRAMRGPTQTEAELATARAALTELVRAIRTAPLHTWVTGDQARRLSDGETLAVRAPHRDWPQLHRALNVAQEVLGDRRG